MYFRLCRSKLNIKWIKPLVIKECVESTLHELRNSCENLLKQILVNLKLTQHYTSAN